MKFSDTFGKKGIFGSLRARWPGQGGSILGREMQVVLLIWVSGLTAFGQADTTVRKRDIVRFGEGIVWSYSGPLRWEKKQWMTAAGVVAGTAAIMAIDEPVRDFWIGQDSRSLDVVERVGYHFGKPYSGFTATTLLYVPGVVFKNEWMRETGLAMGMTMLTSGILQTVMKSAVGRSRPAAERGAFSYKPFTSEISYHAFPGGHITVATTISYVMARRVKSVPVKILFYSLAGTTLVSRLYSDSHWLSDEVFGAAMTVAFAEAALRYVERTGSRKRALRQACVFPSIGGATLIVKL